MRMWAKKRRIETERLKQASRQHCASNAQVRKAALDQVDRHAILVATLKATLDRLEAKR
jgi:hypothetical protein